MSVTRMYNSIAKERKQILDDARNILNKYDFERVKEELDSMPRSYGAYGAELIYNGEAPDAKLVMFKPTKTVGQTSEAFIEGDRGISKRT